MVGLRRRHLVAQLDPVGRNVTLTATTTLNAETHANRTLLMGASGASLTFTLPAATGSGNFYRFEVSVVNTSGYVVTVTGSDTMSGSVHIGTGDDTDSKIYEVESTDTTLTFNATTTGGERIGDFVVLHDIVSGVWSVRDSQMTSDSTATPVS